MAGAGSIVRWSPDGREVFYLAVPGRLMVTEVQTEPAFNAGTPMEAFALNQNAMIAGGPGRHYDLAPAGDRFLLRTPATMDGEEDGVFSGLIVVQNWTQELLERVPIP